MPAVFAAVFATVAIAMFPATSWGQSKQAMQIKVYRVIDLVVPTPDYVFEGIRLPGLANSANRKDGQGSTGMGMGGMGGGMGGFGGGGGMGGGGMFGGGGEMMGEGLDAHVPPTVHGQVEGGGGMGGFAGGGMAGGFPGAHPGSQLVNTRITLADLVDTITSTVEPSSWADVGGQATISSLKGLLIIQQTTEAHEMIAQLLTDLREAGAAPQSVKLQAYWVALDPGMPQAKPATTAFSADWLSQNSDKIVAQAEITCFDGQTVHIISGDVRTEISSMIPVVGQLESIRVDSQIVGYPPHPNRSVTIPRNVLAQVDGSSGGGSILGGREARVGYQPVTRAVNVGVMLQVTPLLVGDAQSAIVDVHNVVVAQATKSTPIEYQPGMKIDPLSCVTQQFQTTIRLPVNQLVPVGGMTLQPTSEQKGGRLLLLLEVSVGL
jgi:hypothetical protein